jgi:hypothetical protein
MSPAYIARQVTEAHFWTIASVEQGLLVGWHKFGPKWSGSFMKLPVTVLPNLKNW